MPTNVWRGDATSVTHKVTAVPAGFSAGSRMDLFISNKRIRATATSDEVSDVVSQWISAITNTTFPEWQKISATNYTDAAGVVRGIFLTGPSDGEPFTVTDDTSAAPITVDVVTVREGSAGQNCVQKIALQVTATGGTFTLGYRGSNTAALNYNDSNATIQTALEGLSGIGAGNVNVTGTLATRYVEFVGSLAETQVDLLEASGANLTGGASVSIERVQAGTDYTNLIQQVEGFTNVNGIWYGSVVATINGSNLAAGPIFLSSLKTQADAQADFDSVYGAANTRVTRTVDDDGYVIFRIEYQGIYAGTDVAQVAANSANTNVTEYQSPGAGVPEKQRIRLLGSPTSGTFTVTYRGQTTAGQAYNVSAATLQSALEGLSTIGSGNISVTLESTGVYLAEFDGTLATGARPLMTGSGASLTGATFFISYYQDAEVSVNEVQQVSFSGVPSSGNFTLTYDGQTTGNIAYNASAATITTALEALSNIGAGDVSVTGDSLGPFQVEFTSTLAATDVEEMTGTNVSLAGAGTESITIATYESGTGPNYWSDANNWSLGAIPVDGDTVILDGEVPIKWGLSQSGVDPALVVALSTFTGGLGLPDWNPDGYYEYLDKDLTIGTAATALPFIIGEGEGSGCSIFRVNAGSAYLSATILRTGASGDKPAVLLRGGADGSGSRIELMRGTLGYCMGHGDTGTVRNLVVGYIENKSGDATFYLGSGATIDQIKQDGGFGIAYGTGHKMLLLDGVFKQERSGWTIDEWIQRGGEASMIGTGTVSATAKLSGNAALTLLASDRNISFANPIEIYGDQADLYDPTSRAIITAQTYMERDYIETTRFGGMAKNRTIRDSAL